MLLDLQRKPNLGVQLFISRIKALPKNFWFILLGALLAQGTLIWFGTASGDPFGDVRYVYAAWVNSMNQGHYLLGITEPWVYPFLAQVPIWLASFIVPGEYMSGWYLLVVNTNMLLIAYILGWGKRIDRYKAAWFFIACVFLIGPVAIARLEVFSVALSVMAVIAFLDNKESKSIQLFNLATWIKVSPMAALASILVITDQKKKYFINLLIATAVILAVGFALGGRMEMFSFIGMQSGRGIQIESGIAIIWLVQLMLGIPGIKVFYDQEIVTFQIQGFGVTEIASIMTFVQLGALAITLVLAFLAKRKGVDRNTLFAWTFLTATLDLVVFNKVGSPQYELWVVAAAMVGMLVRVEKWRPVIWVTIVCSGLSWLIFPVFYGAILDGNPFGVALLVARNLGVIFTLIYANRQLIRLARG